MTFLIKKFHSLLIELCKKYKQVTVCVFFLFVNFHSIRKKNSLYHNTENKFHSKKKNEKEKKSMDGKEKTTYI